MKKKRRIIAALAAALVMASGCQKKYEPVVLGSEGQVRTTETGGASDAGQESGQTGIDPGRDLSGDPAGQGKEPLAQTSVKEQNMVGEPVPALRDVDETVYVNGDSVNLRASASTASKVVAVFKKGDKLRRTGYGDEWSRVEYEGMTCYIASRYVSASAAASSSGSGQEGTGGQSGQAAGALTGSGSLAGGEVAFNPSWKYGEFSKINSGKAMLYKAEGSNRKGITVCVNAGHGTSGGSGVKTLCHPDGTPKVTGGTTGAGATSAVAVSGGMTFSDGTAEAKVTLAMAKKLKEKLLTAGYDVLMIRESDDVQLDNIARTVIANNCADCHIALHWDSTSSNKGAFYMSVPNVASYRNMEPVKSNWEKHNALGESLVAGLKSAGVKIFSGGSMEMDLTQTSFSTVPSIDIELGDKASDHSDAALDVLAAGLLAGVDQYFGQ
jgi:N-acetylmuramoyl-L-alanine amidase